VSYSVQLYSVRNALAGDAAGTLDRLAAIGFTQVEPFDFVARADVLEPALVQAGLTAPSGHAGLVAGDRERTFDAAERLGIGTVIEPYVGPDHWQDHDSIARTAEALNAAAEAAAKRGLQVGYHNHHFELEARIEGTSGLEHFATLLDPAVVLEVDTYWAATGGADPAALLGRLGDRVKFIHIKDGPATLDTRAQVPAGDGTLPIWDIIDAATGLDVGIVEFDDYDGDLFDGLARSLAFLERGRGRA
jgi:sugar phosphate isomerase/epimerase